MAIGIDGFADPGDVGVEEGVGIAAQIGTCAAEAVGPLAGDAAGAVGTTDAPDPPGAGIGVAKIISKQPAGETLVMRMGSGVGATVEATTRQNMQNVFKKLPSAS